MKRLILLLFLLLSITSLASFNVDQDLTTYVLVVASADSTLAYDTVLLASSVGDVNTLRYRFAFAMAAGLRGSHALVDTAFVAIKSRVGDMWKTIDSFATALPDTTVRRILPAAGDSLIFGDIYSIVVFDDSSSDSAFVLSFDYNLTLSGKDN